MGVSRKQVRRVAFLLSNGRLECRCKGTLTLISPWLYITAGGGCKVFSTSRK